MTTTCTAALPPIECHDDSVRSAPVRVAQHAQHGGQHFLVAAGPQLTLHSKQLLDLLGKKLNEKKLNGKKLDEKTME